jgi:ABC-type antimicrobial peptide transport system permease subunit
MLMDTDREREISLGITYPFEALKQGECLISQQMAEKLQVGVGENVYSDVSMTLLLNTIIQKYNDESVIKASKVDASATVTLPCKVAGLLQATYGKIPNVDPEKQMIMEYAPFLAQLIDYLPASPAEDPLSSNTEFKDYLRDNLNLAFSYSDMLLMTLPAPRYAHYESSNFDDIQKNVLSYSNEIVDALGFYPVSTHLYLLDQMKDYSMAVMFIGLIFDIILILFIVVSILLIYSLLMISVETKTFEFGVMRMVGLSERGFITMILT